jgi:hypothetical protein
LSGSEHRGCWQPGALSAGRPVIEEPLEIIPAAVLRLRPAPRPGVLEGFVPVELAGHGPRALEPVDPVVPAPLPSPPAIVDSQVSWADRDSLFGD